jgi:hypothetical protein
MDTLITSSSAIKSLGDGKFAGYLVRFSDASQPDLAGDYFTADTDFGMVAGEVKSTPVYYNHALDPTLKTRKIGTATMELKEAGVWFEGQLQKSDAYIESVDRLLGMDRLGASSGTAAHLVERKGGKKSGEILHWPLGLDASLTPEPCDPYNHVVSIKSAQVNMKSIADLLREIDGGAPVETKGVLGNLTPDIAAAAFDRLSSRLSSFVYQQLWGDSWGACCYGPSCGTGADDDPEEPVDRAAIAAAIDEYGTTLLSVLDALLALPKADAMATKAFLAQFDRTGSKDVVTLLSAMPIKTYLETMGAVVSDSDRRLAWYAEQRAIKQGRAISAENLAAMQDIHDGMRSHLDNLKKIIEKHSSASEKTPNIGAREFTRYLAIGAQGAGASISF